MRSKITSFLTGVLLCSYLLLPIASQAAEEAEGGQSLDQAANDPTASLMNIQLQNLYSGDYYNLDDESGNIFQIRSAVPFTTGSLKHIARVTLPIITDSPSGENGLGDLVLFDLIAFDKSWGRWGAGAVTMLPTASDDALGSGKWGVGPALGFIARSSKFMWGVFNQNIFSFAGDSGREDVGVSTLQPIINISLPDKWSIGTSEMNVTYDWEKNALSSLPLGIKANKMVRFGKLPTMFSCSYEYNFQDDYVAPEWTVNFTVKFLFPL